HRAKPSSPSHQSSLTSHPDNAKYYTSCHYACAPVVARQLQTTLSGDRAHTSVIPSGSNATNGHYHPGSYPQRNCQQINYHRSRHHQFQQPCLIITPYGQVPAHTSSLVVPQHSRYGPSHYRKFDGTYSSSSVTNSDRSPVYESIGDTDSIRERARGRGTSLSECEFCDCGGDHCSDQSGYTGYHDPVVLGEHQALGDVSRDKSGQTVIRGYSDSGSVCLSQAHEDPPAPCPPMFIDGYYGDKCPQTLPLRPLRCNSERADDKPSDYADIDHDELSPLKRKNSSSQNADNEDDKPTRRRPSSGSCYSNNSSHYREGQRRAIPALHPNYFATSHDEIS
ncbi:unnamed protein product, partial [Candidula unifasciata]